MHYVYFKEYKAISDKLLYSVIIKYKNVLHNWPLIITHCIMYMIVTHYLNKMLYNKVFFGTNLLMF